MMNETVEIPLNMTKIALFFIGAQTFVLLGIFYTIKPATFISFRYPSETLIRIVGLASVIFFGVCFVFITRTLLNKKVGLKIDKNGILDNSNVHRAGLIEWLDITGFKSIQVASATTIIVKLLLYLS